MLLSTYKAVMSYSGHLKQALTKALQYTSLWILSIKKISPILRRNSNCFNGSVFSTFPFTKCAVGPTVSSPCKTEKKGMLLGVFKNFLGEKKKSLTK